MKHSPLHKALCSALIAVSPFLGAYGRHLSPEEALYRLQTNETQKRVSGSESLTLAYVDSTKDEEFVYVFNIGSKGFIVVSADDRMPAMLGYSDSGAFDPENASPALKWWLSQYAEEAAASFSSEMFQQMTEPKTRAENDRPRIPFLLSTQWDQKDPYNLDCPEDNNVRCVTGCVATAMAQVIKYHGYPEYGNSYHKYQVRDNAFAATHDSLYFNYSDTRFNYSDMLDKYSPSASDEQRKAVANLMYACGVSVDMEYSKDTSGASDMYIPYALRHYFKYDNNVRLMQRNFYSANDWEDLIYSELKESRPVIMGGKTSGDKGHQFVCDGYDGNGYFHFNWGWNGTDDGYYLLTALNPPHQGTGGHAGGYNYNQTVIIGIQPANPETPVWYPIYTDGGIKASGITNTTVKIGFDNDCGIFNYSQEPVDVTMLIKAVATDGTEYLAESGTQINFSGNNGLSYIFYPSLGTMNLPTKLSEGDYKCYLVFRTPEGNIQEVMFPYTSTRYFNLTIDANGNVVCTAGDPDAKPEIRVVKFEPKNPLADGVKTDFVISIENTGDIEYIGDIYYMVYPNGSHDPIFKVTIGNLMIAPQETINGTTSFTPTFGSGVFDIIFHDKYSDQISEVFQISVNEASVDTLINECSEVDVFSASGMLIKGNAGKNYINSLSKGLYIIKKNGKSFKLLK